MKDRISIIYAVNDSGSIPQPIGLQADSATGSLNVRMSFFTGAIPLDGISDNSDAVAPSNTANKVPVVSRLTALDTENNFYKRVSARAIDSIASFVQSPSDYGLFAVSFGVSFDGTNYQKDAMASAANLALQSGAGAAIKAKPGEWAINSAPAANTTATVSKAAVAGKRHVCKGFSVSINAVAAIAAPITVVLRDGASGAGTILWQDKLMAPAGTTARIDRNDLNIIGSINTAMTIEFSAAPGATNFEVVNMNGYTAA